jgi:hypothetical protein
MSKLKLDLGALRVESFESAVAVSRSRGTVHARGESTECFGIQADTDYCSAANCTYSPCTNDDACLMATLPPKCL